MSFRAGNRRPPDAGAKDMSSRGARRSSVRRGICCSNGAAADSSPDAQRSRARNDSCRSFVVERATNRHPELGTGAAGCLGQGHVIPRSPSFERATRDLLPGPEQQIPRPMLNAAGLGMTAASRSCVVEGATKDLSVGPTERLFARCSKQRALRVTAWRTANGERRTENREQRTENGRRRTEDGERKTPSPMRKRSGLGVTRLGVTGVTRT